MASIKQRLEKIEEAMGKGQYEVMTHEGFVSGSGETRRVSKLEYDKHMRELKELA